MNENKEVRLSFRDEEESDLAENINSQFASFVAVGFGGGGLVKVSMNGYYQAQSVEFSSYPNIPLDRVEQAIKEAVNDASKLVAENALKIALSQNIFIRQE